ncbi:MAG TPA: hypothetical protein VEU97_02065 [Ktedonobacteraceae bacterium]|nr:hypothetical protein [Ktedonobacteraceae bacterium]
MENVKIQSRTAYDTVEQLPVSSQRTFPPTPFPRKYVHSVFDNLQDAVQAVQALRAAGFDDRDIHLMAGWDFVEAVERRRTFLDFLFSIDYDVYLHEARRRHHILALRLARHEQKEQVRDLLAPHRAYLMKYVDTWTVTDLLPARGGNISGSQIYR